MDSALPTALLRDAFLLLAQVGGPICAVLLAVGLVMGILQAATQINDPAVGFVPRLCTAVAVCWLMGAWIVQRLAVFFAHAVTAMVAR